MGKVDHGNYIDIPVVENEHSRRVKEGETFRKVVILNEDGDVLDFDKIIVEKDAKAEICVYVMPGASCNLNLCAELVGEGASVDISGIYLSGKEEKVNFKTEVRHRVANCLSNQMFKGIANGKARFNFDGKIVVAPDAQKTEAYQSNHNIVLSRTARVDTEPQLEIYADDVKCSHGATVGALNEDEQFYMRSRGIPEEEAKVLQMISFVAPVIEKGFHEDESYSETFSNAIRSLI